jgi:uncharacterized membrane protein
MTIEALAVAIALAVALWLRPWRLLSGGRLLTPLLGTLVLVPWLWALPSLHKMPLQLPWSGACLVLLMLGWPLAVPAMVAAGVILLAIAPVSLGAAMAMTFWQGVLPATLALGLGAVLRRWAPHHMFVYLMGRAFLGTAVCLFATSLLAQAAGHTLPGISEDLSTISRWLTAWGEAVVTGMLGAIFVAYRPQWLATWSDERYLK